MSTGDYKGMPDQGLHPKVADCLGKLAGCARSMSLYGRAHPVLQELIATTHEALSDLLDAQGSVALAVLDSRLTLDSFPLDDGEGFLGPFTKSLQERKVGELKLTAGLTADEIADFAEILCLSPEDLALRGDIGEELRKRLISHIEVRSSVVPSETREGKEPTGIYEDALSLIEDALKSVRHGLQIPLTQIRAVVEDSLASLTEDEGALLALAGIRSYDRYLMEHSVNVSILSMLLGKDLGVHPAVVVELGVSGMLHDVGKVFISDEVVKKPGKLSEEEWQEIRRHPAEGARALAAIQGLPVLAPTIALEHHAYPDGTGYPSLDADHKPHILSRLVSIVDTYDALTTDRPYRERWSGRKALAWMLYDAPGRYDRQLLARFASKSGVYPIGSLVQLANGEFAVVVGGTMDSPAQPSVRMVSAAGSSSEIIDLSKSGDPSLGIMSLAQPVEALLPYADMLVAA